MLAFFEVMCYYTQARYQVRAYAPVAQLDRVTDYESVGRGFESLLAYQKMGNTLWCFPFFGTPEGGLERAAAA